MYSPISKCAFMFPLTAALFAHPVAGQIIHDVPALQASEVAIETTIASVFYSAIAAPILLITVIAAFLRQRVWVAYTTLVLLGLVYICFYEQNLTGVIWTGYDVSERTLLIAGYAMYSVNFLVASFATPSTHKYAWVARSYLALSVAVWGFWLLGSAKGGDLRYLFYAIAGVFVALAHFLPVSTFIQWRGGYDSTVRNAFWVVLMLALTAGILAVVSAAAGQTVMIAAANRAVIAAISMAFAFLFIRHMFVLSSDREVAIKNELEATKEKMRVSNELIEAKEKYDEAQTLARSRNLRLATASHDIRQPIFSLRASFEVLAEEQPPEIRGHLQTSLDYLDELAESFITESKDKDLSAEDPRAKTPPNVSQLETALVAGTLRRMFEEDARDRGLDLQLSVEEITLQVNALALMRVLANLITNAIKHAEPGQIAVDGILQDHRFVFSVTNKANRSLELKKWVKDSTSSGSGLGLTIVQEQAELAGFELNVDETDPDQITVAVSVPQENAACL